MGSLDPDPGWTKNYPEKYKKLINFIFSIAEVLYFRVEGFPFSLDALYGGLGISKLQFLILKKIRIRKWKWKCWIPILIQF
jgi:hypothetical protein